MADESTPKPEQTAEDALRAAQHSVDELAKAAQSAAHAGEVMALPTFTDTLTPEQAKALDLLSDVNLNVKIELGRTRMLVEDVLRLGEGAVVELDKLAGDPVDVYVNDRHVARGEVLVLNDNFCVRISEILSPITDAGVKEKKTA